ncbi:hypothetical protein E1294_30960 [Nonomuraea diastatica]|uniref:Alpha/beta hydrolase n=1 Tax=Nonomuraea diastatica TaxID=1848329 RepID=A0A4R4WJI9_9ACTN|nr:hypothetical protein E1294_30960 [Nonomuraea diastatica]
MGRSSLRCHGWLVWMREEAPKLARAIICLLFSIELPRAERVGLGLGRLEPGDSERLRQAPRGSPDRGARQGPCNCPDFPLVVPAAVGRSRCPDDDFGQKVIRSRAIDIPFVLDQLAGPRPKWKGSALINPDRIAMAGQSIGGAAASEAMLKDSRVRAGINMDGSMFLPIPKSGLARPFMLMGAPSDDSTWERDWERLTGWKRWLVVKGALHPSFTDYDMLLQQLGIDLGGGLKETRSMDITRTYVGAFVDLHLRGKPQPLLDKSSPRYPEASSAHRRPRTADVNACAPGR